MSFGLIGGSSFGRPNMGWSNSSSMKKSTRKPVKDGRSGGRIGGKNFHSVPGSPGYMGGAPKQHQTDRVSLGLRDASVSASGKFNNSKADRMNKLGKPTTEEKITMKSVKRRGKYSSNGSNGNDANNKRASFSFDKSINNGISALDKPVLQNPMGGGAHLQSLELPSSKFDDSKLFVKNIQLKPTGLNLPNSDVANFFKTRIFPAYIVMLQERVNYKISLEVSEFQQWFFNIQEALNLWFYVNSVLSYYDRNPSGNEGMSSMRNNINSESLNLYDQLGKILETKVIDPSMVSLIRYMHDVYQASPTNPQSAIMKFSYEGVVGEDSSKLEELLEDTINNLSNVDLLKVNSLMKKAKPEWEIRLHHFDGTAKYDENFMTFWANIPEKYKFGTADAIETYMKPYATSTSQPFNDDAQFGIYGNDYSAILNGLSCFNISADGKVTQSATVDSVHSGFIQPTLFSETVKTSNLRWESLTAQFVAAGEGTSADQQTEAMISNPTNVVMRFQNGIASQEWPYTALKAQCQEPITMTVESTRQDFNFAMSSLFNWTDL